MSRIVLIVSTAEGEMLFHKPYDGLPIDEHLAGMPATDRSGRLLVPGLLKIEVRPPDERDIDWLIEYDAIMAGAR